MSWSNVESILLGGHTEGRELNYYEEMDVSNLSIK